MAKRTRQMSKQTAFVTVSALILLTVSGCAGSSTVNDFCSLYQPVPTLHEGTEPQQLKTDENNAVYMERCR